MLTRDEVIWGYRFLLGREPESEEAIAHHTQHKNVEAFRISMMTSPEFFGKLASVDSLMFYPGYRAEELSLFDQFHPPSLEPAPGFVTDFLGSRTRISSLWDGIQSLDGAVLPVPIPSDYHAETVEWLGLLKSVASARDRFAAMELGAGIGPWLVAGSVAAKLRGISDIRLFGVEADPGRFALMQQHFRDNGLDPRHHELLQAGVGVQRGRAKWPKIKDYRNVAGARPVRSQNQCDGYDSRDVCYLGGMVEELIDIEIVNFEELLERQPIWDLIHIDVQGTELELCRSCIHKLSEGTRYLVVGTHSRKIDGDLLELMRAAGWLLENEKPCRFVFKPGEAMLENMTVVDGSQVWSNPRHSTPK